MIEHAEQKEVGVRYGDGFGKRPDVLTYPRDVIELALQNVTSFHASEEIWENPLMLNANLTRKELDELRIGWDLVLDVDCAFVEYSKICAHLIVKFLQYCQVKDLSIKFSGNKGFHIGVPFEAFPKQVGDALTKDLFPEAAKKVAFYIKENIKEELGKRILQLENGQFNRIREKVNLPDEDIIRYEHGQLGDKVPKLNVDKFLEIDTVLISSRHLYRMPYSLHEKSGLASLPIDPDKVMEFEKPMAIPEKILTPMFPFLDRNVSGESARQLLVQALDFEVNIEGEHDVKEGGKEFEEITFESPIKEELFPPCIKKILVGLEDGKKRAVFILINFLGKIGWSKKEIEEFVIRWNKEKNPEPLREVYIKGQLNHFQPGNKLPPNCNNDAYYKGLGMCLPDGLCKKIRNPVNYTIVKWKSWLREKEGEDKKRKPSRKSTTQDSETSDPQNQSRAGEVP